MAPLQAGNANFFILGFGLLRKQGISPGDSNTFLTMYSPPALNSRRKIGAVGIKFCEAAEKKGQLLAVPF